MDAKALERIEGLALTAAGKKIEGTDIPVILLPAGVTQVSLENLLKQRVRFRGTLDTVSFKDFVQEAIARQDDGGKAFIKAESNSLICTIIHNIGTTSAPGHCDDKTILTMEPTTGFAAMKAADGCRYPQQAFAEWLEDWSSFLKAHADDDTEMLMPRTISAVRNIKIEAKSESTHQVGNMSTSRSAFDNIAASSADLLPAYFTFTTTPYDGMSQRTFKLRLSVLTGEKPQLVVRWVQKEAQIEEITQEFKQLLKQEIGGFYSLVLGSFNPK